MIYITRTGGRGAVGFRSFLGGQDLIAVWHNKLAMLLLRILLEHHGLGFRV